MDDDPQTLRQVRDVLSKGGYTRILATSSDEALHLVESETPNLSLLDLALPGVDGFALMRDILDMGEAPMICLSAQDRDQDIERALELGAADYMVKPFSPTELTVRIGAALRRTAEADPGETASPFVLGELTIDYAQRRVAIADHTVHLTPTEYILYGNCYSGMAVSSSVSLAFTHSEKDTTLTSGSPSISQQLEVVTAGPEAT